MDHCNYSKGFGSDIFDGFVLKDKEIKQKVAEFITKVLNSNKLPHYLREFRLSVLSKTRSSEVKIEDTRPIAIGSHLLKIVEKTIKLKIEKLKSNLFVTEDYQSGFQAGISTQKNLAIFIKKNASTRRNRK